MLLDYYRVHDGKLMYIYDSWMKSSYEIVKENSLYI